MIDKDYILPSDALKLMLNALQIQGLPTERLPIEECFDRISALDIVATEDLPAFSKSTVDGYAINSMDSFGVKEHTPAYLTLIIKEVQMGIASDFKLNRGEVSMIPTGGMVPEGADAVLMLEYANIISGDMIEVLRPVSPNENIIKQGEDIKNGETVLIRGSRFRPQDIGALAGIGVVEAEVFKKFKASIISTGDEIVPPDSYLKPGQVRDINSYTLSGLISQFGGVPVNKGIYKDDYLIIREVIQESVNDSDLVLISGGTSAGAKDMASDIIDSLGAPGVIFHGVALKPGKPLIGGVLNNKPVFGLPGHPAAVIVCFYSFIKPVIERLFTTESRDNEVRAIISKNIASSAGREDHIRVQLKYSEGEFIATPILGKSGLISTLVNADGIVVISPEKLGLNAGDIVNVRVFR